MKDAYVQFNDLVKDSPNGCIEKASKASGKLGGRAALFPPRVNDAKRKHREYCDNDHHSQSSEQLNCFGRRGLYNPSGNDGYATHQRSKCPAQFGTCVSLGAVTEAEFMKRNCAAVRTDSQSF